MRFYIYNFGCKVNSYESNIMKENMISNGYVFNEDADIYIINTCTVTNTACKKCLKVIRQVKKNHPDSLVVVTGCLTQVEPELVDADIVIGNVGKSNIAKYIKEYQSKIVDVKDIMVSPFEDMKLNNFDKTRAFIKIEDGCENYCSYCIIPYARGKVRSKKKEIIFEEVDNLVKNGHKEIVLSGIHTGHYNLDNYTFSDLLNDLVKVPGLERIRISSIEINEITDEVLDVFRKSKVLVDHIHIPLQSGSNEILKLMNRKYLKEEFISRIDKIRSVRPNISITTDLIVGFPNETDELFNETIDTIKKIRFSKIHVFPFSRRKNTKADLMDNQIDEVVKKERVKKIIELSKELELEYFNKHVNKEVIFIPEVYKDGYLEGHTGNYLLVRAKGCESLLNRDVKCLIKEVSYPYCIGEISD